MITLITDIPVVVFSKSPSRLKLQTNNSIQVNGQFYSQLINLSGTPLVNQTFIISFLGAVYTFTGVNTPDDSGIQFKFNATNLSQELCNVLNANYSFHNSYNANYTSPTSFSIVAKSRGTAYNISYGGTLTTYTLGLTVLGVDRVYRENFSIIAEVWSEEAWFTNDFKLLTTLSQVPDDNGMVEFNFQKNLEAIVGTDVDLPDFGATSPSFCSFHNRRYFIQYAEQWGVPLVTRKLIKSATKTVYNGGISDFEYLYQPDVLVTGFIVYGKKFLHLSPPSKPITRSQEEYLFIHFPSLGAGLYVALYVDVTFTDNTVTSDVPFYVGTAMYQNEIWYFPVGHDQLDLAGVFPGLTVQSYKCRLKKFPFNPSDDISEEKEFVIDCNTFEETTTLIFKNSTAGLETLRLRSYATKYGNVVSRRPYERYLSSSYNINNGGGVMTTNNEGFNYVQAVTGLYSKEYCEYFAKELLHSEAIFENRGGKRYPVILRTDDIVHVMESPGLYSFSFEYRYANNDVYQTTPLG